MNGVIPPHDPVLARRLRRQLMATASWLMFLLPAAYAVLNGWMGFGGDGLLVFLLMGVGVNVLYFVLIRSGWTRRFRDPSMTVAQIFSSQLLALALLHFAEGDTRSVMLTLFVASLFFGVFGLRTRDFLLLTATAVGGYVALVAVENPGVPWTDPRLRVEGLRALVLAMILLWMSLLGSYVGGLRTRLEHRNAELGDAMAKLRAVASHDELTGVHNRRHLLGVLDKEKERADRFGQTFSVALIDLDHFKQVNDTRGHAAGDDVLRGFAGRMLGFSRKMDWVGRGEPGKSARGAAAAGDDIPASAFGRYGGEEFLLVMPQTSQAGAVRAIERLRARTSSEPFDTVAGPVPVTFSAGVAEYLRGEAVSETLARADGALYEAKANGRNRTEAAKTGA